MVTIIAIVIIMTIVIILIIFTVVVTTVVVVVVVIVIIIIIIIIIMDILYHISYLNTISLPSNVASPVTAPAVASIVCLFRGLPSNTFKKRNILSGTLNRAALGNYSLREPAVPSLHGWTLFTIL